MSWYRVRYVDENEEDPPSLHELFDLEPTSPVQENAVSSSQPFYSGRKYDIPPCMSEHQFISVYQKPGDDEDYVFIENSGKMKLSEYNFSWAFFHSGVDQMIIYFPDWFAKLFKEFIYHKFRNDTELQYQIESEDGITKILFTDSRSWPPVLACFVWQCSANGLDFFELVSWDSTDAEIQKTVFA
ncbi:ORF8 [Frog adenovirus 1]|uniref:ORF8 n=1 Tax=Frog adenovirus 1 (strain ATCC VR-896) TaxID=114102 RepID=Q9IIG4_ADEF1|nr:ORF8 [Frog adenovirus 1]AAF86943.1 ORF8 [Frog adenovirus 1]